jgi:glutathionyl-hydroquinone reductase
MTVRHMKQQYLGDYKHLNLTGIVSKAPFDRIRQPV